MKLRDQRSDSLKWNAFGMNVHLSINHHPLNLVQFFSHSFSNSFPFWCTDSYHMPIIYMCTLLLKMTISMEKPPWIHIRAVKQHTWQLVFTSRLRSQVGCNGPCEMNKEPTKSTGEPDFSPTVWYSHGISSLFMAHILAQNEFCIPKNCHIEKNMKQHPDIKPGSTFRLPLKSLLFSQPFASPPPKKKHWWCIPTASWPKYVKRSAPSLRGVAKAFCWLCGMFTIQNPTHFWLAVNWTQAIEILFQSMAMFLNVSCFSMLLPKCEGNILPLGYFYDTYVQSTIHIAKELSWLFRTRKCIGTKGSMSQPCEFLERISHPRRFLSWLSLKKALVNLHL